MERARADYELAKYRNELIKIAAKDPATLARLARDNPIPIRKEQKLIPAKDKNPKWTPSQKDSQRAREILKSNNVGTGSAPPIIVNNTTQNVSQGDTNSTVVTVPNSETESFPGFGQRSIIAY
jgi:hypothetical protein